MKMENTRMVNAIISNFPGERISLYTHRYLPYKALKDREREREREREKREREKQFPCILERTIIFYPNKESEKQTQQNL